MSHFRSIAALSSVNNWTAPTQVDKPCLSATSHDPMGVLDIWMWARRKARTENGTSGDLSESLRWLEGYERLAEMAPQMGSIRLGYVADWEADIMTLVVSLRCAGGLAGAR